MPLVKINVFEKAKSLMQPFLVVDLADIEKPRHQSNHLAPKISSKKSVALVEEYDLIYDVRFTRKADSPEFNNNVTPFGPYRVANHIAKRLFNRITNLNTNEFVPITTENFDEELHAQLLEHMKAAGWKAPKS